MNIQRFAAVSPARLGVRLFLMLFAVLPVTGAFVAYGASGKLPDSEGERRWFYIRLFSWCLISQFIWLTLFIAWVLPWVVL